ncbi:MAG: NfeD family protein [Dehalococcoidales bacterium]|nr:NfeD family protein [Dehalococcoidales bacterium]
MKSRFIFFIVSTILEEVALAVIVLLGLPRIGIQLPLVVLIVLMAVWAAYSLITYRVGSRALSRKPVICLPDMVGSKGMVVSPLAPEGLVRIRGELWIARPDNGEAVPGDEIAVVEQYSLKLVVHKTRAAGDLDDVA